MKMETDDARLTAYALGELDPDERDAVEAAVRENAALAEELEAIRRTGQVLSREIGAERGMTMGEEQRRAILESAARKSAAGFWFTWKRTAIGVAAVCLVTFGVGMWALHLLPLSGTKEASARYASNVPSSDGTPLANRNGAPLVELYAGRGQLRLRNTVTGAPSTNPAGVAGPAGGGVRLAAEELAKPDFDVTPANQGYYSRPDLREWPQRGGTLHFDTRPPRITPWFNDGDGVDVWVWGHAGLTPGPGGEDYAAISENGFVAVPDAPLSTFSIDVDTASYTNVRRFLHEGKLPPKDAVRIEELINYFQYDYPNPEGEAPVCVTAEVANCPWNREHTLARIGLKGKAPVANERAACNLVFLLDVSGSMAPENKLPLIKRAMRLLVQSLDAGDRIGMVAYNTTARTVLDSTPGNQTSVISSALDGLSANGTTNGGAGLDLAYDMASQNFVKGGINRVILATDGDFNTGLTEKAQFVQLIEQQAQSGVFLTVLGFGEGNLKDATLEALADKGNGHYAYIDSFGEARRVLLDQVCGTLMTVAKDVKIQVEFNPAKVGAYRLIGYENRALAPRDFNDDRKDAGDLGAGQTVTALYELVPPGKPFEAPGVDALKYQKKPETAPPVATESNDLMTVKLRYKPPEGDTSARIEVPVAAAVSEPSGEFRFAASVAEFGMLLRDSEFKGGATFDQALDLASQGKGSDVNGQRAEYIDLVKTAQALTR